jgi:hypothetical protein
MNNQHYDMFSDQSRRDSLLSHLSGGSSQGSPPLAALNMHPQQYQPTMAANNSQGMVYTDLQSGRQYTQEQLTEAQRQQRMRIFAQMSSEQKQAFIQQQNQRRQQAAQPMAASPVQVQANGVNGFYTPEQVDLNNRRNAAMMAQMSTQRKSARQQAQQAQQQQQQQSQAMSPHQRQQSQQPQHQQQQSRPATSATPPEIYFTAPSGNRYTREEFEQRVQGLGPEEAAIARKLAAQQQQQLPRPATGASPAETYFTDNNNRRYTRAQFDEGLKTLSTKDQAVFRKQAEQQQQDKRAASMAQAQQQQQRPAPALSETEVYFTDDKGNGFTRAHFDQQLAAMAPEKAQYFREIAPRQQLPQMAAAPAQARKQQQRLSQAASPAEVYFTDGAGNPYTRAQFDEIVARMPPEKAERARLQQRQQQQPQPTMAVGPAQAQQQQPQQATPAASSSEVYVTDGSGRTYTEAEFEERLLQMPPEKTTVLREQARLAYQKRQARTVAAQAPAQSQPPQEQRPLATVNATQVYFRNGKGQTYTQEQYEQELAKLPAEKASLHRKMTQHQNEMAAKWPRASPEERAELHRQNLQNQENFRALHERTRPMPSPMAAPQAQAAAKASGVTQPAAGRSQVAGTRRALPDGEGAYSEGRAPKVAMFAVPTPPSRPSSVQGGAVAKKQKKAVVKKAHVTDIKRRHKNVVPLDQVINKMATPAMPSSAMSPPAVPASAMSPPAVPASTKGPNKANTSEPMSQNKNTNETIDLTSAENDSQPMEVTRSQQPVTINSPGSDKSRAIDLTDDAEIQQPNPIAYELEYASLDELGAPISGEPGVHGHHLYALQNGVKMDDCEYGLSNYNDIMDYSFEVRLHHEESVQQLVSKKASWMYDGSHATDMVGLQKEVGEDGVKKEQMSEEAAQLEYEMRMRKGDGPWGADWKGRKTWV